MVLLICLRLAIRRPKLYLQIGGFPVCHPSISKLTKSQMISSFIVMLPQKSYNSPLEIT